MTDRLIELLTDTPEEAAYDEAGRQAIIWGNLFKAAVRPEVQALRDRVRELETLLNSLMEPTKTTFGATLEGEATE